MDAESIKNDSHCLWEAILRFLRGEEHHDDADYSRRCYESLRDNLTAYYESRRTDLDESEVFFAQAVLSAYQDLSLRKIVQRN